jgi:hypothetical protein
MTVLTQLLAVAFPFWLGLYLLQRDRHKPVLLYTGLGLLAYSVSLALSEFINSAPTPALVLIIQQVRWPLLFLPALCWCAATLHFLPEEYRYQERLTVAVRLALPVVTLLLYGLSFGVSAQVGSTLYRQIAIGTSLVLGIAVMAVGWGLRENHTRPLRTLLFIVSIFLALSVTLMLFPELPFIASDVVRLLVGADLLILGALIARLDALDEGSSVLRDALQSLGRALLAVLLFGGQVLLFGGGMWNFTLAVLLFGLTATAIFSQVYQEKLAALIDRLIFARQPMIRHTRAELRAVTAALPRQESPHNPLLLPEDEFIRLTRRALSNLNDPGKLVASPLIHLPVLTKRLAKRGLPDHSLERAAELRALLTESIARLKPRDTDAYGIGDEWRYYNALQLPYVEGIKFGSLLEPDLEPEERAVVEWFRIHVPERTLHNWQNAAARLIAQDVRERQ